MLVMPLITEAGFGIGGSYGRGALRINGTTSGLLFRPRQAPSACRSARSNTLIPSSFMTDAALRDFRESPGWAVGGDVRYALNDRGGNLGIDTTVLTDPVIAVIYGQAGLILGANAGRHALHAHPALKARPTPRLQFGRDRLSSSAMEIAAEASWLPFFAGW